MGTQRDERSRGRQGSRKPAIEPNSRRFINQTAIVVGGAQGIGKAIAFRLAGEGAKVLIADIDRAQMRKTAHEIEALDGIVQTVECDVRKKSQVNTAVKKALRAWARIDVLIYVAGVSNGVPFIATTDRVWDRTMDINLKGAFWFAQAVAKKMINQRSGKLVFMSSTNAWDAEAELAPYNISKAGLFLLAKTLARELGKYRICSNSVAPGLIRTRLTEPFLRDPKFMKKYADLIPLGRLGVPEDIAGPALFLASKDADYVNGSMLFVDGGQLA